MFFFFNDTATTEIYTLSLHDALPIWTGGDARDSRRARERRRAPGRRAASQVPPSRSAAAGAPGESHSAPSLAAARASRVERAGLSRDRNADPHQAHARRRA